MRPGINVHNLNCIVEKTLKNVSRFNFFPKDTFCYEIYWKAAVILQPTLENRFFEFELDVVDVLSKNTFHISI